MIQDDALAAGPSVDATLPPTRMNKHTGSEVVGFDSFWSALESAPSGSHLGLQILDLRVVLALQHLPGGRHAASHVTATLGRNTLSDLAGFLSLLPSVGIC